MRNPQAEITERILACLKAGTLPWRRPWRAIAREGFPCNAATGRPYSGSNIIALWAAQMAANWPTMRFVTFRQARKAGGGVRKGEKGTAVVFLNRRTTKEDDNGETRSYSFLKVFTVFNVAQCDGLPASYTAHTPKRELPEDERNIECEFFLTATGASISNDGGSRAFYRPATDSIHLPTFGSFRSGDLYYSTAFHELAHWTGHEDRCARVFKSFGSREYAFEELVAEIASSFVSAEFQVENVDHTAAYIDNWISLLRDDDRAFVRAAAAASRAVEFLRARVVVESDEEEEAIDEAA